MMTRKRVRQPNHLAAGIGAVLLASAGVASAIPADSELPETVCVTHARPPEATFGNPSYFDSTVTDGGILNGIYDGWCVDNDRNIFAGFDYKAEVLMTVGLSPEELEYLKGPAGDWIEFPENLDLLNWIINQDFPGSASSSEPGNFFTYGDVQRAIWEILDDSNSQNVHLGDFSKVRQDEIVALAYANGEGYVPECGDKVAIILRPFARCDGSDLNQEGQLTIIEVPCECECELEVKAYCKVEDSKEDCKKDDDRDRCYSKKDDDDKHRYGSYSKSSYSSYSSKSYSKYSDHRDSRDDCKFLPLFTCAFGSICYFDLSKCEKECEVKAGTTVKFIYHVSNPGDHALANVVVTDSFTDTLGDVPGSPIASLEAGASVVLYREVTVTEDVDPNLVIAASESELCTAEDEVTVKVKRPEPPKCDWDWDWKKDDWCEPKKDDWCGFFGSVIKAVTSYKSSHSSRGRR